MLTMDRGSSALLRSNSGPGAHLSTLTAPTSNDMTLTPELLQATARRRLI